MDWTSSNSSSASIRRTTAVASLPSTRTVDCGTKLTWPSSTGTRARCSASRTESISAGAVTISKAFSARRMSVAPASSAFPSRSSSSILAASTWMIPWRSNIHATAPEDPMLPPNFSNACRISGPVRLRLSVRTWIRMATPPGAYPSYVTSSYDSPGSSPVPFWIARLMFSCGMFASFADSIAAFKRMLALGSPPPFFAATVISRRIFEKTLPRWTSVLPFLRLICDHRECPDIVLPSFVEQHRLESLHALEPLRPPTERRFPPTPRARGRRRVRRTGSRTQVGPEMHERQEGGAGVPDLARPRDFGQNLHADLERRGADVIEPRPERDDLVREDRRVEVHRVHARGHHEPSAVSHRQDPARLVERHEHLADEHGVAEERVLRQDAPGGLEPPADVHVAGVQVGVGALGKARRPLGEPRQPLLASGPRRLDERRFDGVPGLDLRRDGPRAHVLVDLHEHQVRVQGHPAFPGKDILGEDAHPHFEGARADVLDPGPEDRDLAHLDGMEEVDVIHRAEDHRAARHAGGGQRAGLGDPLHHASAMDLPRPARVLGENPFDHLDRGLADRRHTQRLSL